jgi:Right handed beta helix region
MRASMVVGALALVVVVGAGCKRTNGAYCDDTRPCASGLACDLTARECHAIVGGGADLAGLSIDMAGCNCSGPTPICVAMTCVSCMSTSDPDGACKAASQSTPHCASDGTCVGCRDATDCGGTTPYCDATTHQCRGCIADSECTSSLVCDLTSGPTTRGNCIPTSQVEYVDCGSATNGNGLSPTTPRNKLQDGINKATTTDARPYVRVTGLCIEAIAITGAVTVYVVGADGATVKSTMNGKDAFGVQNSAQVTIRNLIITATMGANGGNCSLGGGSFTAYHTQFINTPQTGVYSDACELTLDGCTIAGNQQGGVYIVKGDFTVKNTVIAKNMDTGFVQAATGANTVFVNNTVADNHAPGLAGVSCAAGSSLMLVNTILYGNFNAGNMLQETTCTGAFMATDDVSAGPQSTVDLTMQPPGFVGGGDYHLLSTSPCLDHGTNTMGAPDHDGDWKPRPDGTAKMWDIGAFELQK